MFQGIHGIKVTMDDITTYGSSQGEHDTRLRDVLERTQDNNLRLKKPKCHIEKEEVKFHGHVFTRDGLTTDPEKVRAIFDMPRPTDKVGVQRLLGLINYVNKFIPNIKPIERLTGRLKMINLMPNISVRQD